MRVRLKLRLFCTFLGPLCLFPQELGKTEIDRFFENVPPLDEPFRGILLRVENNQQPDVRFSAVEDLVHLGDPSIPLIEKVIEGGHREKCRVGLFTLSKLGSASATKSLERFYASKRDLELEAWGFLVSAEIDAPWVYTRAIQTLNSKNAEGYLRLCAALSLSASTQRLPEEILTLFKNEASPEIAGALAIAVGKNIGERSIGAILQKLSSAKEPALRAGLWLGLAYAGGSASAEMVLPDLESDDMVLGAAAALTMTEIPQGSFRERWDKVFQTATPVLKSAMIEGLARAAEFRSRAFLHEMGQVERDWEVRKAILRTALKRHDYSLAFSMRKNRAGESLGGLWALTLAILHLEGRPSEGSENKSQWLHSLAQGILDPKETCPEGIVLYLGAIGAKEEEAALRDLELSSDSLREPARLARKFLRGGMDVRAYQDELRLLAGKNGLLPEQGFRQLRLLYAQVLLGAGSRHFESKSGFPNQALLSKADKRKYRPIPLDSTYYEDLWSWLRAGAFGQN